MSIIMGAIGGLGEGMQANAKMLGDEALQDQHNQAQMNLAQMQSDLALQKEKALEQFKIDMGNTQRQQMTERIGTAQQGIVAGAIGNKYAGSNAAVADADAGNTDAPLTDDQRAAITQSKQSDTDAMMSDPDTYTQAAMKTGDLDPKTVATVNQRDQAAQYRLQAMQERMETLQAMNKQTNDTRTEIAKLHELIRGNGKIDTATGRMMITSLDTDMKANLTQLKTLQDQMALTKGANKPALQAKIDEINEDTKKIRQQKQAFFDSMNLTQPKAGTAAPAATGGPGLSGSADSSPNDSMAIIQQELQEEQARPVSENYTQAMKDQNIAGLQREIASKQPKAKTSSSLPALPAGAKQIGTSGGKPVFETLDGKRFIQG